jgi:hypothetical protein
LGPVDKNDAVFDSLRGRINGAGVDRLERYH